MSFLDHKVKVRTGHEKTRVGSASGVRTCGLLHLVVCAGGVVPEGRVLTQAAEIQEVGEQAPQLKLPEDEVGVEVDVERRDQLHGTGGLGGGYRCNSGASL